MGPMKRISSAILAAQATAIKYIGLLESPKPRKTELMMLYAVMNGMPMKQMVRYCTVPGTASAGTPIRPTSGRTAATSTAVKPRETAMNRVTVLPMAASASRILPAPTAWPMMTVEPMASPTMITVSMCMTWLPLATAVMLSTPQNRPVMYRSAMPYSVCKK